ncbi:MAG: alpha/beta hydrolase [Pseudomonadota bacterium]
MPLNAWLGLTEVPRAGLDVSSLITAAPFLALSPRGDGHPVLVIPGFMADDDSTWLLRQFLQQLGYQAHPWQQQRNLGATAMGGYETLVQQVLQIHRQTGQRVSLVGWSLGGVHALAVAYRAEYAIRQVITLGSPIVPTKVTARRDGSDGTAMARAMQQAARAMNARPIQTSSTARGVLRNALLNMSDNLPVSSIYSRADGVVPWRRSLIEDGPQRENIEVVSSHIGLGFNASVLYAIADRLGQEKDNFNLFHRQGMRQLIYPDPSRRTLN